MLIQTQSYEEGQRLRTVLVGDGHTCLLSQDPKLTSQALIYNKFTLLLLEYDERSSSDQLREASDLGLAVITMINASDVNAFMRAMSMMSVDYIVRPFTDEELLARVHTALTRWTAKAGELLSVADVQVMTSTCSVYKQGVRVQLTPREYALLLFLLKNKGKVFTREQLLENIWCDDNGLALEDNTRTVDIHIQRLRRKLGLEHTILTIQKIGYCIESTQPELLYPEKRRPFNT